jgi:hypothetical protein
MCGNKKSECRQGKIPLTTTQGIATVSQKLDMLNAYEYAQFVHQAYRNAGYKKQICDTVA